MFVGYMNDPVKTTRTLTNDGWLKTGDLGKVDRFGRLFIVATKCVSSPERKLRFTL